MHLLLHFLYNEIIVHFNSFFFFWLVTEVKIIFIVWLR